MFFTEDEVKKVLEILVNNFSKFELHLDLLYKGTVKFSKEHDTLKKMDNVVFKWGVKDGSEIVKLEPKLKQIGLINFTKKMGKTALTICKKDCWSALDTVSTSLVKRPSKSPNWCLSK